MPIAGLPSRADRKRRANLRLHRAGTRQASLNALPLPSQIRIHGEDVDARPYQLRRLRSADEALLCGRRRLLTETATDAGKTLITAILIKHWLQATVPLRVLFLADGFELAKQEKQTFEYLRDYLSTPSLHLQHWSCNARSYQRHPYLSLPRHILASFTRLVSTSANSSGAPTCFATLGRRSIRPAV